MNAKQVVLSFWQAMQSNDFDLASQWLAENYVCYWPQSGEVIRGRENFIAINTHYPANGLWRFDVQQVIHEGDIVVTDVSITDGRLNARALTFHTVVLDKITMQKEYWPDDYEAPSWRAHWVERVDIKRG